MILYIDAPIQLKPICRRAKHFLYKIGEEQNIYVITLRKADYADVMSVDLQLIFNNASCNDGLNILWTGKSHRMQLIDN